MGKYIDRAALFNSLTNAKTVAEVFAAIQDAPAADVAEVVRCKDCKWLEKWHKELPPYDTGLYCTRPNQQSMNLLPTDYCSYGEAKHG